MIEKKQDELLERLEKVEHLYDRMDRKIGSIILQSQHLETFIGNEIKRSLNSQEKQKTIDLLAARSIQHEADIKELTRVVKSN